MVFTTHLFVFYFLPLTLLVYYAVAERWRVAWLVVASYVFYGWSKPWWAALMFGSTLVDYVCGLVLVRLSGLAGEAGRLPLLPPDTARTRGQKAALAASIGSNLLLLGFFKYYDFGVGNLNVLTAAAGRPDWSFQLLHLTLPIGISFYSFQSMSYAIDVYRGDARAMSSLIDFCCFETLYPHLVAGPIVRYSVLAEQIRERTHSWEKLSRGIAFFCCGMAKKILIANPMGYVADTVFTTSGVSWYDAWFGLSSYSFQIYFDFSGYSDMAVGLGLMIGFCLVKNFDSPYCSESITEFWQRWHISLSTWLRDYLYIPLGGNRLGRIRTYVNLMATMLLGGLWHGASWNFVLWGALHGGMLALERATGLSVRRPATAIEQASDLGGAAGFARSLRIAFTFFVVCLGWVFFRVPTLPGAWLFLKTLFGAAPATLAGLTRASSVYTHYHGIVFASAAALVWGAPTAWNFTRELSHTKAVLLLALLGLSIVLMWTQNDNPFLYFQF